MMILLNIQNTNDKWFIQHKHIYNKWLWPTQTNKNSHMEVSIHVGMFKNNEAFHFMASHAHICLDLKGQT